MKSNLMILILSAILLGIISGIYLVYKLVI